MDSLIVVLAVWWHVIELAISSNNSLSSSASCSGASAKRDFLASGTSSSATVTSFFAVRPVVPLRLLMREVCVAGGGRARVPLEARLAAPFFPNQLTSEALKRTAFRSPQALASWKKICPKQRCSPAVPAVSAVSALYGSPKLGDPNCRHHVIAQLFYSLWGRKQCSAPARVFTHVLCRCGE